MECHSECAACCIYVSISSPIPGMPNGKPAGVRCVNLSEDLKCTIFDSANRPKVCAGFKAEKLFCGNSANEAYSILAGLEGIKI